MSQLLRILAACALVAACTHTDAAARDASKSSRESPPAANARSTSASGTVASAARDTISDRADRGRILGDSNAKVWLVMASDFQCPYCKQWHEETFPLIMKNYISKGTVRLAYLNFPLKMHQHALPAAEAAMCASVQNKFWPMHDSLFATQHIWETLQSPLSTFDTLARESGVGMPMWRQCMSKHLALPLINADHDRIADRGVNSTPVFFVGDAVINGAQPYSDFQHALDAAIAKAQGRGAKPGS
jgi:protein-disulfide isomerase